MNTSELIGRTPFRFKGSEDVYEKSDVNGNRVRLPYFNNGGFCVLYGDIVNKLKSKQWILSENTLALLMEFVSRLTINSNIVRATRRELAAGIGIKEQNIAIPLDNLIKIKLISPYGSKTWIVNHNYLFKGDLLKFYNDYKELYPDEKGETF